MAFVFSEQPGTRRGCWETKSVEVILPCVFLSCDASLTLATGKPAFMNRWRFVQSWKSGVSLCKPDSRRGKVICRQ